MSDLELLRVGVSCFPEEKFRVQLLAEEIECKENVTHFQALRHALKVKRDAINLAEIADALEIMDFGSPWYSLIYTDILLYSNEPHGIVNNLVVVAGSRPPHATSVMERSGNVIARVYTYTVGARWLIARASEITITADDFFARNSHRPDVR